LYCLSFLLAIVLSVLSFSHCIVYPFFWPLHCLSFLLASVLSVQIIQWPKERTDNALAKRKDRQCNGQKKGQTIQWPKQRTNNTMTKRKDRQYDYHFQSTRVHPWVFVAQSLVFCVVFCRSLFVLSFFYCLLRFTVSGCTIYGPQNFPKWWLILNH
jgi:ABC-type sugar transport system permease subunit